MIASFRRHLASANSRPFSLTGVEPTVDLDQLPSVQEPSDITLRVLGDAEAGVASSLTQSPFLGPEHHHAQDREWVVGCTGPVPARRVEPCGYVFGADAIQRRLAERRRDARLEVDAHRLATRRLPVGSQHRRYLSANSCKVGVSFFLRMSLAGSPPARMRASMSRARRRASASSISPCRAMTMRRLRPSTRACTIQTLRPDGRMRRPKPGVVLSNSMVSLACGLLWR